MVKLNIDDFLKTSNGNSQSKKERNYDNDDEDY